MIITLIYSFKHELGKFTLNYGKLWMDKLDEEKWCSDLNWWQARRHNIVFDFTAIKQINTFSIKSVLSELVIFTYKLKTIQVIGYNNKCVKIIYHFL